jgi:hypothetical protein
VAVIGSSSAVGVAFRKEVRIGMEKEEDPQEMNFLRSTFEIEPMGLSCCLFERLELWMGVDCKGRRKREPTSALLASYFVR